MLVTYTGSLTGRDFCAIVQVTSLVLYDLVPESSFDPWVRLGRLMPMVWQPVIDDVGTYLVSVDINFWA